MRPLIALKIPIIIYTGQQSLKQHLTFVPDRFKRPLGHVISVMGKGVEQITKADRLRVSRSLQQGKARATLRRLSSTVRRIK